MIESKHMSTTHHAAQHAKTSTGPAGRNGITIEYAAQRKAADAAD